MTDTIPERYLHESPCPQSIPDVWVRASDGPYWEPILPCTCSPEAPEPSPQPEKEDEPRDVDESAESEGPVAPLTTTGGWCAPSNVWPSLIPEVTAKRGGLQFSFTPPKPLEEWTKKELRAEVEKLREFQSKAQQRHIEAQDKIRRLERKVKRLLKIIGRIA